MAWSKMIDLELSDDDKLDQIMPIAMDQTPDYPCGLRICLTEKEIAKLGLDVGNCDVGDLVDMRCFGEITSKSCNQINGGDMTCRVEIQIQRMSFENEETE